MFSAGCHGYSLAAHPHKRDIYRRGCSKVRPFCSINDNKLIVTIFIRSKRVVSLQISAAMDGNGKATSSEENTIDTTAPPKKNLIK